EAALVYGPGMGSWTPAGQVEAVRARMRAGNRAGGAGGPPPPPLNYAGRPRADEIDYQVFGSEMQYVEVTPDPGETVIADAGGMMYMSAGITMQTVFGDPSQQGQGFMGELMTAGKRVRTGESLFMT